MYMPSYIDTGKDIAVKKPAKHTIYIHCYGGALFDTNHCYNLFTISDQLSTQLAVGVHKK